MKSVITMASILVLGLGSLAAWGMSKDDAPFASNVDASTGVIQVPANYREWPTLGTWAHAKGEGPPGIQEFHVVYTQPETINYYKAKGRFPDGAVLVKELLNTETMPMTTGPAVGHGTTIKGWFVLVRDTKGRFPSSALWGDGWGWSLFQPDDPNHTVSKDYKTDCLPCHTPARELAPRHAVEADQWIYTLGYPVLRKE